MAGKGGGAWKVAYADFVTAMMAVFMVMWICSQDQKFRQSVARYFNNPANIGSIGSSSKSSRSGTIFESPEGGDLPGADSVSMGRGREAYTHNGTPSRATKLVGDWLHQDSENYDFWKGQAKRARLSAGLDAKSKNKKEQLDSATLNLSRQLREEVIQGIPTQVKGIYQEFLFRALGEVNWGELAEDLIAGN